MSLEYESAYFPRFWVWVKFVRNRTDPISLSEHSFSFFHTFTLFFILEEFHCTSRCMAILKSEPGIRQMIIITNSKVLAHGVYTFLFLDSKFGYTLSLCSCIKIYFHLRYDYSKYWTFIGEVPKECANIVHFVLQRAHMDYFLYFICDMSVMVIIIIFLDVVGEVPQVVVRCISPSHLLLYWYWDVRNLQTIRLLSHIWNITE